MEGIVLGLIFALIVYLIVRYNTKDTECRDCYTPQEEDKL